MEAMHRLIPWRDNGEDDEDSQDFTSEFAVDSGLCC